VHVTLVRASLARPGSAAEDMARRAPARNAFYPGIGPLSPGVLDEDDRDAGASSPPPVFDAFGGFTPF